MIEASMGLLKPFSSPSETENRLWFPASFVGRCSQVTYFCSMGYIDGHVRCPFQV